MDCYVPIHAATCQNDFPDESLMFHNQGISETILSQLNYLVSSVLFSKLARIVCQRISVQSSGFLVKY
ncbi:hypothetical protein PISMIDRAFT_280478 [Pisolithus microcarpus 441]|uniref:Unplaced genomic scaffold scaffold_186, whole genome shotgun sequence n=1 Tax=Pisolithus microcarpus 441 TaxID=765257 RepID=A0A0C9Z7Y7_9AGAM|nr:hypothetical protein PISMIDRAFT_280478 [Pisolithus microcarpus 441]